MVDVPYFDGDTPDDDVFTYAWTGVPHASASTRSVTTGIWVDAMTGAPVPRVGITVDGLDGVGPSVVTVWRSTVGGVRRKVRGWDARRVFGSDFAIDYEAPLGRLITYELQVNSGAVVPLRLTATAFLDVATGFIQDPLLPLGAVPVSSGVGIDQAAVLTSTAFRKLQYEIETSSVQVLGARERVATSGQRMSAAGVDFSVLTEAAEQGTELRNLFANSGLVLVRPLPSWGPLPDLIYTVPSVTEEVTYGEHGPTMTTWNLVGDTVRPPSIQVLVALWTYDQVAALWATYGDAQSAANLISATYLDSQRDPTMGV